MAKTDRGRIRKKVFGAVIILLCMIISWLAIYNEWFFYQDYNATDQIYRNPGTPSSKIKIIAIDEKSLQELGAFGTWNREVYARLVDKLAEEAQPAIIGFDVIMTEKMEETGDQLFAEACARAGNVVVARELIFDDKVMVNERTGKLYLNSLHIDQVLYPYEALDESAQSGFVESTIDKDGALRRAFWELEYNGSQQKPFVRVIAEAYAEMNGIDMETPKTDEFGRFGFGYTGEPGDYEHYSLVDVLNGAVDLKVMKDSIVLIGAYAEGLQDNYYVSATREQMYGVEVQCNVIQACLEGNTNVNLSPMLVATVWALIIGIYTWILGHLRFRENVIVWLSVCIAGVGGGVLLYHMGYYVPVFTAPLIATVIAVLRILISYLKEIIRRRQLINVFERYVGTQVADFLTKDEFKQMNLEGELKDVAVLFVDIRSFTSLSESLEPREIVELLNNYLSVATRAIFRQRGMLDKFIGDAAMAVFNAPVDVDDYEYRAVQAAFGIVKNGQRIADYTEKQFGCRVEFGIGIHCGPAVVGNIGCDIRLDYTAIGDTVNTASRIEGRAKGGQILISSEMRERLGDRIRVREAGWTTLKGKKEQMMLYEVTELMLTEGVGVVNVEGEIQRIKEEIGCDAASMWLIEEESIYPYYFSGPKGDKLDEIKLQLDQGVCGYCISHQESIVVNDVTKDKRWYKIADDTTGYSTKNLICVPIVKDDKCIGCIELLNKEEDFTADDLKRCNELVNILSTAGGVIDET